MNLRPTILLFGDSLTQFGFGEGTAKFGWCSLLSSAYQRRADVINRGFSGYNTRFALDLVPKVFGTAGSKCNHLFVTVFLGANDAAIAGERQHVPLEEYRANLAKIIQGIREETKHAEFPIIVMTPPPIHEERWKQHLNLFDYYDRENGIAREYGLAAKAVAAELGCSVLDSWELLGGDKHGYEKQLCDGLHLSESGNEALFNGLMALIKATYPNLAPQELVDGNYQGPGLSPEDKLWDELC